jgi:hypothetical protein
MSKKKPDLNYIAGVEKAVAEKYGKVAAQDFRSGWDHQREKDYLDQLKDAAQTSKKNVKKKPQANRTCPICKTYSFSSRDDLYMNRFQCCQACYIDFVHQDPYAWLDGKRPTDEALENILRRRKNGNCFGNN